MTIIRYISRSLIDIFERMPVHASSSFWISQMFFLFFKEEMKRVMRSVKQPFCQSTVWSPRSYAGWGGRSRWVSVVPQGAVVLSSEENIVMFQYEPGWHPSNSVLVDAWSRVQKTTQEKVARSASCLEMPWHTHCSPGDNREFVHPTLSSWLTETLVSGRVTKPCIYQK